MGAQPGLSPPGQKLPSGKGGCWDAGASCGCWPAAAEGAAPPPAGAPAPVSCGLTRREPPPSARGSPAGCCRRCSAACSSSEDELLATPPPPLLLLLALSWSVGSSTLSAGSTGCAWPAGKWARRLQRRRPSMAAAAVCCPATAAAGRTRESIVNASNSKSAPGSADKEDCAHQPLSSRRPAVVRCCRPGHAGACLGGGTGSTLPCCWTSPCSSSRESRFLPFPMAAVSAPDRTRRTPQFVLMATTVLMQFQAGKDSSSDSILKT